MPHPCALDATLEGCAELAAQHALETVEAAAGLPSLKEALVTNAPVITERLNAAMVKVGEWVEATETLAVEQAPFLVQEILYWGIADRAFWLVLGTFFVLIWPAAVLYLRKDAELKNYSNKMAAALNEEGSDGSFIVALVGGIIAPILGFIIAFANVMNVLKPIVAPRLYLIEYFKELMN
jgi:hypothetical protein